jgi:hypothetical protein
MVSITVPEAAEQFTASFWGADGVKKCPETFGSVTTAYEAAITELIEVIRHGVEPQLDIDFSVEVVGVLEDVEAALGEIGRRDGGKDGCIRD